jgi:hypothetical protein
VTDPRAHIPTRSVTVNIPTYSVSRGLPRLWPDHYSLKVEIPGNYVTICGDPAGLRGLATQLLALAEEGVPTGYADDLDDLGELDVGSVQLTIVRQ